MKYIFTVVLCLTISINCFSAEPNGTDRLKSAVTQVITAFAIKDGLDKDSYCRSKKYAEFSWNEWAESFPKNSGTESQKAEMLKSIKAAADVLKSTKAPNVDATLAEVAYLNMKDLYTKLNIHLGNNENICDQLYDNAKNIFQKSKDNIKLMK